MAEGDDAPTMSFVTSATSMRTVTYTEMGIELGMHASLEAAAAAAEASSPLRHRRFDGFNAHTADAPPPPSLFLNVDHPIGGALQVPSIDCSAQNEDALSRRFQVARSHAPRASYRSRRKLHLDRIRVEQAMSYADAWLTHTLIRSV
jgi:hypothetical protein